MLVVIISGSPNSMNEEIQKIRNQRSLLVESYGIYFAPNSRIEYVYSFGLGI